MSHFLSVHQNVPDRCSVLYLRTAVIVVLLCGFCVSAQAGQVRGQIDPPAAPMKERTLGYTRTQIGAPSPLNEERRAPVAVFLKAKKSHSIPPPKEHPKIQLQGYRMVPNVAACAVDGKVTFINADKTPLTITVGGANFATLKPEESKDYECTVGESVTDQRKVQLKEWPHAEGSIYVGPTGVAGAPNEKGAFTLEAPQGEYELQVVGHKGVLFTKEIALEAKTNANVGKIELGPKPKKAAPPRRPPPRRPPPPRAPPPAPEGEGTP